MIDKDLFANSGRVIAEQAKRELIDAATELKLNAVQAAQVDLAIRVITAIEIEKLSPGPTRDPAKLEQDQKAAMAMLTSIRAIKSAELQDRVLRIVQTVADNAVRAVLRQITAGGSDVLLQIIETANDAKGPDLAESAVDDGLDFPEVNPTGKASVFSAFPARI